MNTGNKLNQYQEIVFGYSIYIIYILLFFSYLGLSTNASIYLQKFDFYFRIYICLFLMWRFNPFKTHYEFTNLDRRIAFSAGLFIFTITILNTYSNYIKEIIQRVIHKI
jgi:hypothetical protein